MGFSPESYTFMTMGRLLRAKLGVVSMRTVDAKPLFSAQGSFPQSLFVGTNSQRPRRRIRLSKQLSAFKEVESGERRVEN